MEEENVDFDDSELCVYERVDNDDDDDSMVESKRAEKASVSSEIRNILVREVTYSISDNPVVAETVAAKEKTNRR